MTEKNPSAFDVMGAFNDHYNNGPVPSSLAVIADYGKSVPASAHIDAMQYLMQPIPTPTPALKPITSVTATALMPTPTGPLTVGGVPPKPQSSFFTKVLNGMETAYNFSAQAASFALLLDDKNNPLRKGLTPENLTKSWDAARQISAGRAFIAKAVGNPLQQLDTGLKDLTGGKVSLPKEGLKEHLAFAAPDFNIYDPAQADKAFRQQNVGRFTSWGADVVARFTIDPTILAGKAVKAYKVAGVAVKGVTELKSILAGEKTGLTAKRVKANFNQFVTKTDGMEAADLFRVKAIRESSNPGSFSEVLADANKIEDKTLRHQTKSDIVLWAMGDPDAAVRLMNDNKMIASKIGNLQDEIAEAKHLGSAVDKATGQLTMDLVNSGENLQKNLDLAAQYEKELADNYKSLSVEGSLSPKQVPALDFLSSVRREISNSQAFIDIRGKGGLGAAYAAYPVRLLSGFAYKRPKGWIDFTDNQSVQTLDNMLSRVRGINDQRIDFYNGKIEQIDNQLKAGVKDEAEREVLVNQRNSIKEDLKTATFTVDRKNELFNKYISALDPTQRANVYQEIEQELFNTVARQFGYNTDEVRSAWAMFSDGRAKAHNLIRERAYTAAIDPVTGGPVGGKITPIMGLDGTSLVVPLPLNETQLVKQLPTLDVDSMYRALNKYTRAQRFEKQGPVLRTLGRGRLQAGQITNELTDGLDSIIKFEVLARLGYPVRNVGEGMLRIMQVAGPMAILARAGTAVKNTIGTRFKSATAKDMFDWSNRVKLETYKAQLQASLNVADDASAVERQIAEIDGMLDGSRKMVDKFGVGLNQIQVGNELITYEDALGATAEKAQYIQDKFINNAAQIVDSHFGESSKQLRNAFETNGDFVIVKGNDPQWEDSYLRVINRQVRNSKLTSILLQNKPREQVVKEAQNFLLKTDDGRKILQNLALGRDVESIVEANMQNVESLFPNWISPQLKAIASKRNLTSEDLKKYFGTAGNNRPDVNGAQVALANGTSAVSRGLSNFLNHFYNIMGEIPEAQLVRNPLFVDLYRKRMVASVENAIATYPGKDIPAEYIRKVEYQARQWARAEMRRTLYDTSERVDAAHMLKYVFPFFGAWADVTEKWGRMILDDPSVFRKLQTTYASPDRTGITEERDGISYINIPGSWGKRLGLGDRPLAIPKPSLNLIFQGGAWWNPGAGWFVQYPMSKLLKRVPELEKNYLVKQVLPYGADGTGWQDLIIQSSAARRAMALFDENNPVRKSATVLIAMEENHKYDMGERDTPPTAKEINDKVKKILALEIATRLTLPFATNTRSPYQFYIDEYHRMRQEDPENATKNFYDKYGDKYFIFTTNLSKNNTGIAATVEAAKRTKQFSDLIASNPEYGWFVVGDANAGEFSPTVYQAQRETPVAPGSSTKMRESQDPLSAIKETNANKGWTLYNKGMDLIESIRIKRGLTSLQAKGAEDLKAAKDAFVAGLEQSNPDWAEVRGKMDTGKIMNFLKFAQKATQDPRLANRPDIQTMSEYLKGRQMLVDVLAKRKSHSLTNKENADLKGVWDTFTGLLIDKDITFNKVYTRILEKDDLRKGL
jgi:hypothetical protein